VDLEFTNFWIHAYNIVYSFYMKHEKNTCNDNFLEKGLLDNLGEGDLTNLGEHENVSKVFGLGLECYLKYGKLH
jgi:hypothetical protein